MRAGGRKNNFPRKEGKMNSMTGSYEAEAICPHCGMSLLRTGTEREVVPKTAAAESQMSLIDILVLPVGVVTGVLLLTFPLSLPALYGIALLLM